MKKRIICPPLADTFTKYGDRFERIAYNETTGVYCYRRTTPAGSVYYELFKAPTARDERGNRYARYPRTSEFGFGRALCMRGDGPQVMERIAACLSEGLDRR